MRSLKVGLWLGLGRLGFRFGVREMKDNNNV